MRIEVSKEQRQMTSYLKALTLAADLAAGTPAGTAGAAGAHAECGSCHALTKPDFATLGITERLERQAPPLWYAGNKYREGWLAKWLQAPTVLLSAGYFPNAAIRSTPEGDVPDPDKLHKHVALP